MVNVKLGNEESCNVHSFVAQWLQYPTGSQKAIGSIPVRDSGFFLSLSLVTR